MLRRMILIDSVLALFALLAVQLARGQWDQGGGGGGMMGGGGGDMGGGGMGGGGMMGGGEKLFP
jgi:hypothetical protein